MYFHAKFEVSSLILTSFRQGVALSPPNRPAPQHEPLKNPPRLGLIPASLVTFGENLKSYADISLTAYIDFETTVPTDECLDTGSKKKTFVVSYVIIFGFHPEQDIDRVIIERSFGHSEHSLTT